MAIFFETQSCLEDKKIRPGTSIAPGLIKSKLDFDYFCCLGAFGAFAGFELNLVALA